MSRVLEIEKFSGRKHFFPSAPKMIKIHRIRRAQIHGARMPREKFALARTPARTREPRALPRLCFAASRKFLAVFGVAHFPSERGDFVAQFVTCSEILCSPSLRPRLHQLRDFHGESPASDVNCTQRPLRF